MTTTMRYLVPVLAAIAVGGAIASAPAAFAATKTPRPAVPSATVPIPSGDGSDPLVPTNTGANPFVFVPQGDELPG